MVMNAAAYDFEAEGVYYSVTSADEVEVAAGEQPYAGYFSLPTTVSHDGHSYQLTAIGDKAFLNCSSLVGVTMPQTLRRIGESAFCNCTLLCSLDLPAGLETIGDAAFYGCASLYTVKIPASVSHIGDEAFVRCATLFAFQVDADNTEYSSQNGVLMNKEATRIIAYPNLHSERYTIPEGVQEIGNWAFLGCNKLEAVTMPQSLLTIGNAAFQGCSVLQDVNVPHSVTEIGVWAFSECSRLATVTLGSGVAAIGDGAFSFCPMLQYIRVAAANSHYTTVSDVLLTKDQRTLVAFPGAKGGSYRIPSAVEAIGGQAFFGCDALESVTLASSLSAIGDNPFVFCDNLNEILVSNDHPGYTSEEGVLLSKDGTSIVFYPNAKSGSYTIPAGITALQSGPFLRSRLLTSLTIPSGVTTIGDWTFMECDQLQSVSLSKTVTSIGDRAFDSSSLQTVFCGAVPMATTAFTGNHYSQATLYVPAGSEDMFYQVEGWSGFGGYKEFGLYAADNSVLRGQSLRIPLSVTGPLNLSRIEMDIVLPATMSLQKRDGDYAVELTDQVSGTVKCVQTKEQEYHVTVMCDDQREAGDFTRELLYLTFDIHDGYGVYDLLLKDVTFDFASAVHTGSSFQPDLTIGVNIIGERNISGIDTVEADHIDSAVYNLQGQQVRQAGESLSGLPAGVYVVNGKKVLLCR